MATTVIKTPPTFNTPAAYPRTTAAARRSSLISHNSTRVSFIYNRFPAIRCPIRYSGCKSNSFNQPSRSFRKFLTFSADGDTTGAQTETQEKDPVQGSESKDPVQGSESETEIEGDTDAAANDDASGETDDTVAEEPSSVVISSLNLYKEALANNDESKLAELESFLKSIEDEKIDLERKVANFSEELSYEKDRVLRISADFDNFRKRTERERLSLVANAQGEVLERLLPVLDNFERAKIQIKVETEGEEKIGNSYQSIYKQFVETLGSLGVVPVETVGKPFDPMLHEAIMREDSTEYEDGIIIEEYRKGFQIGDRLLRPSMVKVSAGPGPANPKTSGQSEEQAEEESETSEEGSSETNEAEG